jgi:hypothetical protein
MRFLAVYESGENVPQRLSDAPKDGQSQYRMHCPHFDRVWQSLSEDSRDCEILATCPPLFLERLKGLQSEAPLQLAHFLLLHPTPIPEEVYASLLLHLSDLRIDTNVVAGQYLEYTAKYLDNESYAAESLLTAVRQLENAAQIAGAQAVDQVRPFIPRFFVALPNVTILLNSENCDVLNDRVSALLKLVSPLNDGGELLNVIWQSISRLPVNHATESVPIVQIVVAFLNRMPQKFSSVERAL